eukprot:TRINITY_DN10558_c0_g1_i4.p2 TRINITY_DN10558_c0_g1~~TRINITY_DN10558_c0_g1_i4.p2  ORF type:complete len:137 (-),score=45.03 TRINITY_DN10558_c0_g1_i4:86-496(-)
MCIRDRYQRRVHGEDFKNEDKEFVLIFKENPFADLVELPEPLGPLVYSNVLCGIIRGALKTLNIIAKCTFIKDRLKGDDDNRIMVHLEKETTDKEEQQFLYRLFIPCLLYTSDAADDTPCVDLGGRRIIKKKKQTN